MIRAVFASVARDMKIWTCPDRQEALFFSSRTIGFEAITIWWDLRDPERWPSYSFSRIIVWRNRHGGGARWVRMAILFPVFALDYVMRLVEESWRAFGWWKTTWFKSRTMEVERIQRYMAMNYIALNLDDSASDFKRVVTKYAWSFHVWKYFSVEQSRDPKSGWTRLIRHLDKQLAQIEKNYAWPTEFRRAALAERLQGDAK